jgi:hypothetical protein
MLAAAVLSRQLQYSCDYSRCQRRVPVIGKHSTFKKRAGNSLLQGDDDHLSRLIILEGLRQIRLLAELTADQSPVLHGGQFVFLVGNIR